MRISDWSSDVCSSDLARLRRLGGEGAGKSTQARFIRDWLTEYGHEVVLTREPGGSPLAEAIRGVVLGDWAEGVTPSTEVLLMFAARAAHWPTNIAPALAAGRDEIGRAACRERGGRCGVVQGG